MSCSSERTWGARAALPALLGLLDKFGEQRVKDTPISEAVIAGLGVGGAAFGLRPIVEIMFFDFAMLAMDQIVNQAAKYR